VTRLTWLQPEDLVAHGFVQAAAEGAAFADLAQRWADAGGSVAPGRAGASDVLAGSSLVALAREILDELDRRAPSAPFAAAEPLALADIGATRAAVVPRWALPPAEELADRVHGAWLGRAAGCLLGKPVEKLPRPAIETILRSSGQWPLRGYLRGQTVPPDVRAAFPWNRASASTSLAENISGMPEDDDLNFTMLALHLIETRGDDFDVDDVADAWLQLLPAGRVFTAERIVYRNLLDAVPPRSAALVGNPFREWIGAAIRTDLYGWVNPGDPARAAELAWRDARLTHTSSGAYFAMAVAAMTSAAVVGIGAADVVAAGVSVVPAQSRLAAALRFGAGLATDAAADDAALDALYDRYGNLHWVHSLNNAALVAYCVCRHDRDFAAAIGTAVTAGWDTDSAAATVGSVVGAFSGRSGLDASWVAPLRDRIASSLPGFDGAALSSLADRTLALVDVGGTA
jgi:ADP-ribosylglycohydrolase